MQLDLTTSTCVIEERRWPVTAVICPDHEAQPEPNLWQRSLGGVYGKHARVPGVNIQVETWIPLENGALIAVNYFPDTDNYDVTLYSRTCEDHTGPHGERMWMPWQLRLFHNMLCRPENFTLGTGHWDHAEGEWVNEHLERISRMEVLMPPGPKVELIRFGDVENLPGYGEYPEPLS